MKDILRQYIREALKRLMLNPDRQDEMSALGGAVVTGTNGPTDTSTPEEKDEEKEGSSDSDSNSFGGGTYKD